MYYKIWFESRFPLQTPRRNAGRFCLWPGAGLCVWVKELTIPASVRHIGSHAFRNCLTLEKVIFLEPIEKIGSGIFESCERLSSIVVPKGCLEQFREQLPFYSRIITETAEEE